MSQEKFGYIRVSSKDQNIERQLKDMNNLSIPESNIHIDRVSGKDFNREEYEILNLRLRKGDLLYIKSIDRFGRNYEEIKKEWGKLIQKGIDIKVIDMPLLDTTLHKDLLGNLISNIILEILSFVAEQERNNIKQRQSEGIEAARKNNVKLGRPKIHKPKNFENVYERWKKGEVKAVEAMEILKLSKTKFYSLVREHENRC